MGPLLVLFGKADFYKTELRVVKREWETKNLCWMKPKRLLGILQLRYHKSHISLCKTLDRVWTGWIDFGIFGTSLAWPLGPLGSHKYLMVWMGGLTPERFNYGFYWYLGELGNQIPLPDLRRPEQELLDEDTLSRLQWDALSCC